MLILSEQRHVTCGGAVATLHLDPLSRQKLPVLFDCDHRHRLIMCDVAEAVKG